MNKNVQLKVHTIADLSSVSEIILIFILSCTDRPLISYLRSLLQFAGFQISFKHPNEKVQKIILTRTFLSLFMNKPVINPLKGPSFHFHKKKILSGTNQFTFYYLKSFFRLSSRVLYTKVETVMTRTVDSNLKIFFVNGWRVEGLGFVSQRGLCWGSGIKFFN